MSAAIRYSPSFLQRLGVALAVVAAADFLLYQAPLGLSLATFIGLLGAAVIAVHPAAFGKRPLLHFGLLVAALLPLAENVSLLSVWVAFVLLVMLALSASGRFDLGASGMTRIATAVPAFMVAVPFRLLRDLFRWRRAARRLGRRRVRFAAIAVWIMPVALAAIFLTLLDEANPVIERWIAMIDPWAILELIGPERVAFWGFFLAFVVWPFLRPRLPYLLTRAARALPRLVARAAGRAAPSAPSRTPVPPAPAATPAPAETLGSIVFGKAAVLRALIVFNLMFAVETVLDATYLWGGAALPDGMSYASYAHRGAYPLIVTALLAALFVLVALRSGSTMSEDRPIRVLVYLWVAQNILLVASSILRLELYVGVYALTHWRVAAFIWMGLVAVGLALIIARIALGKSGSWLSSANLLALSITLYACCFINFTALIARYNVEHSREMSGQGVWLDVDYLICLGPAAFPAIDQVLANENLKETGLHERLALWRRNDEQRFRAEQGNWRAWLFRDWRLLRYLDRQAPSAAPAPAIPLQ